MSRVLAIILPSQDNGTIPNVSPQNTQDHHVEVSLMQFEVTCLVDLGRYLPGH